MDWRKDFEVGVKLIDEQHKRLIELITIVERTQRDEANHAELGRVLKTLVEYVVEHFANEEQIMEKISYPDLSRHRVLHADLVEDVKKILLGLKQGKQIGCEELKTFLESWLGDHILAEDKKIGEYIQCV